MIIFTGIGGRIDVTQQGDFGVFGTVAYDERATFNVISVDSLPKSPVVTYDHAARCHTIIIYGEVFDFKVPYGKKGLQVRRFSHALPSPHTHILANTVAQNESLYSKREVDEAKQARKLSRMLAFPSIKDISEAISCGTLIDCPVTIQSLKRAIDIYGMQGNILKGKTIHKTTPHDNIITVTQQCTPRWRHILHSRYRFSPYLQHTNQSSWSDSTSQPDSKYNQQSSHFYHT